MAKRLMDKLDQTVQIGGRALLLDVRSVFLTKTNIHGVVRIQNKCHRVRSIGSQCWVEVAVS